MGEDREGSIAVPEESDPSHADRTGLTTCDEAAGQAQSTKNRTQVEDKPISTSNTVKAVDEHEIPDLAGSDNEPTANDGIPINAINAIEAQGTDRSKTTRTNEAIGEHDFPDLAGGDDEPTADDGMPISAINAVEKQGSDPSETARLNDALDKGEVATGSVGEPDIASGYEEEDLTEINVPMVAVSAVLTLTTCSHSFIHSLLTQVDKPKKRGRPLKQAPAPLTKEQDVPRRTRKSFQVEELPKASEISPPRLVKSGTVYLKRRGAAAGKQDVGLSSGPQVACDIPLQAGAIGPPRRKAGSGTDSIRSKRKRIDDDDDDFGEERVKKLKVGTKMDDSVGSSGVKRKRDLGNEEGGDDGNRAKRKFRGSYALWGAAIAIKAYEKNELVGLTFPSAIL
jgi:hypothetical protein